MAPVFGSTKRQARCPQVPHRQQADPTGRLFFESDKTKKNTSKKNTSRGSHGMVMSNVRKPGRAITTG